MFTVDDVDGELRCGYILTGTTFDLIVIAWRE